MNKPDDVSAEAWETARDIEFDFDCDWTADGRRSGEFERQFATVLIARAIDAAIAKEQERCAKIAFFTDVPNATAMKIHDAIRNPSKP